MGTDSRKNYPKHWEKYRIKIASSPMNLLEVNRF